MDWLDQARNTPLAQRAVRDLSNSIPADLDGLLERLLEQRAGEVFPQVVLAGLCGGQALDARHLERGLELLPDGGVMASVVGHSQGDVVGAVLAAVARGHLGWDLEGVALLLVAYSARQSGQPDPPPLLLSARRLARKSPGGLARLALVALLGLVDDPALEAALGPDLGQRVSAEATQLAEGLAACLLGDPLACLPETEGSRTYSAGPIRRAATKVGRNAACPCGSGQKYKACCMSVDVARQADASEVPGLTRSELRAAPEQHLSVERLEGMLAWELARMNPTAIPQDLRVPWLERLCFFQDYDSLQRAYRLLAEPDLDGLCAEHAADAAWNGRVDLARGLLQCVTSPTTPVPIWAQVSLADSAEQALELVEQELAANPDGLPLAVGYALLGSPWPHLGIWFCRSLLPWATPEEAEPLIGVLQDTRESLGLGPWDPVEQVLYALQHGHDPDTARALTEAQKALVANELRLQGTVDELRTVREALQNKQTQGVPEPTLRGEPERFQPDPAVDAMQRRIHDLKSELKARHDERNALRRELNRVRAEAPEPEAQPLAPSTEEDPLFEPMGAVESRLRLPRLTSVFEVSLTRVSDGTARAALSRLMTIAVGRAGAFLETRRLRGHPQLLRARVGRNYRLLFRLTDETVEAVDLVHRQDLDKRIRQLTS